MIFLSTKVLKSFISEKYNTLMENEVLNKLKRETSAGGVKIAFQLGIIKLFHAKWIVTLYTKYEEGARKNH